MNIYKIIKILPILILLSSNVFAINSNYKIEIQGNEFLDDDNILSIINDIEINNIDEYINEIFSLLNESGNFSDIQIKVDNNVINLILKENIKINNINFIGNKRFKNDELLKIFKENFIYNYYNKKNIKNFENNLKDLYYSYGYNNLDIQIDTNNYTDSNLDLNITINEGKISKINKVFFKGNTNFEYNILQDQIKSKPKKDILFFLSRNFKYYELQNDLIRLKEFYFNNGYKDIFIDSKTEFISKKNKFNIYFNIIEGNKFEFNNFILLYNLPDINNDLKNNLTIFFDNAVSETIDDSNIFNNTTIIKFNDLLSDFLFSNGKMFFEILIKQKIVNNQVDIIYEINSVKPKYVNQINIIGNTRTKDEVIRRELDFAEGDSINDNLISKSNRNLQYLNIFDSIQIKEKKINEDTVDLEIDIKEKSTGDFQVGLGLNSIDGVTFVTGLKEKNIAGSGRNLELSVNNSAKNSGYNLAVTEPFIFNKKINLIYGISYKEKDYSDSSSYNTTGLESKIGVSYFLSEDLKHSTFLRYNLNDFEIIDSSKVSNNILNSEGQNAEIILVNSFNFNKLNSFSRPTKGNSIIFENHFSPITNSDDGYLKNFIYHKKYYDHNKFVFSIKSRIGNILSLQDKEIISDRKFSLGGRSLRGFDIFGVGPRKSSSSYIGGNNLISTQIDFSKSMTKKSDNPIDISIFTDIGTVFGNKNNPTYTNESIRASYGFGIKYYSVIGPIGFSWGFPLADESYDIKRMFLFSIGDLN